MAWIAPVIVAGNSRGIRSRPARVLALTLGLMVFGLFFLLIYNSRAINFQVPIIFIIFGIAFFVLIIGIIAASTSALIRNNRESYSNFLNSNVQENTNTQSRIQYKEPIVFCTYCGLKLNSDVDYCPKCGNQNEGE